MIKKRSVFYFHASADLYGSDYVLLELAKKASMKYNVLVFLPVHGPLIDELNASGIETIVTDLAVLRREYFSILGLGKFIINLIKSVMLVLKEKKKYDSVIFHTNTSAVWTGFVAAWVSKSRHYWQVMELIESPKSVSWMISFIVSNFSYKVFCISDAVKTHFLKTNKSHEHKFTTLYHGVDRAVYNKENINTMKVRKLLGIDESTVLIGFAGRFNSWKGQEVLADAIKIVLESSHVQANVHFVFLGSVYSEQYFYKDELEEKLSLTAALKKHTTVIGFQKDFENWMGSMDIYVLPSKLPEPNATTTIAAMTLGVPVIGTCIGGTVESVIDGGTGYLVFPNDPSGLADKIITLVNSESLRLTFGKKAMARADQYFSIGGYTNNVIHAYDA